jgi:hypothetical protein
VSHHDQERREGNEKHDKPPKVKRLYEKDLLAIMSAIIFSRDTGVTDVGKAVESARQMLQIIKQ